MIRLNLGLVFALFACNGDDNSQSATSASSTSTTMDTGTTANANTQGTETGTGNSTTAGSVSNTGTTSTTTATTETDTSSTGDPTGADPTCLDMPPPAFDGPQNGACASEPQVGTFEPVVEWSRDAWEVEPDSTQIIMMPVVADLDGNKMPDLLFVTYKSGNHYGQGVLRAMSGDGQEELLNISNMDICGHSGLALGDIDGDDKPEIITITVDNAIQVFEDDGTLKWKSKAYGPGLVHCGSYPQIADLNGDGSPEIISGPVILNADGSERGVGKAGTGYFISTVVDLDQDGMQEVLVGNAAYDDVGQTIWSNGESDGYAAVADFNNDAIPDIVVVSNGMIRMEAMDGEVIWAAPMPGGGGGVPTIADFNGDGEPEIGVAGSEYYGVFDDLGFLLWKMPISETASATGSVVYDFEGDGIAEVIHADENRVWIFSGIDGSVKMEFTGHGSGTQFESPIIADLDADGQVEIAFGNNQFYGPQAPKGITVIGDKDDSWRPGRMLWNQYSYYITNVNDDLSIPALPEAPWNNYNTYRSGDLSLPDGKAAPDLKLKTMVCEYACSDEQLMLWVQLGNEGASPLTAGATIFVYGKKGDTESLLESSPFVETLDAGAYAEGIGFLIEKPGDYDAIQVSVIANEEECAGDNNNTLVLDPPYCGVPG